MTDWTNYKFEPLEHQYLHLNESQRRVALALQTIDRLEATLNRLRDRLYYNQDDEAWPS